MLLQFLIDFSIHCILSDTYIPSYQIKWSKGNFPRFENQYWPAHMYRISSYSFHGNFSFFNLEIVAYSNSCRNISIFYLINWIFVWKLFKGGTYMRKYSNSDPIEAFEISHSLLFNGCSLLFEFWHQVSSYKRW